MDNNDLQEQTDMRLDRLDEVIFWCNVVTRFHSDQNKAQDKAALVRSIQALRTTIDVSFEHIDCRVLPDHKKVG
jgi:hypothetical protein